MLFLSIHPPFVDKIMSGDKTIELRRQRPQSKPGDWIAIYSSTPERSLRGVVQVTEVKVGSVRAMWQVVREKAGVTRNQYDTYFIGSEQAVGIVVANPIAFPVPVPLGDLRKIWPEFHPPQSFRYLDESQIEFVTAQCGDACFSV